MARSAERKDTIVREVVATFDDVDSLRNAISDLQENGFMRQELSFLADEKTVQKKLGHIYRRVQDVSHNPETPRAMFMPDEPVGEAEAAIVGVPLYIAAVTATTIVVASGGTLLAALLAASAAGGGAAALGAIFSRFIAKHHAEYIQHQIERGGMLLWVNIRSPEREQTARAILSKHAAHHIQAHEVPLYPVQGATSYPN